MNEKQLLVKEVIDRYPRMLGLLKAASLAMRHKEEWDKQKCVLCQIQALLKEIEQ